MAQYTALSSLGFRRSGDHVYRPHCPNCRDCIPIRLDIARFRPNRSQRRILRMNKNLQLFTQPAEYIAQHYALYRRYIQARHPAGGMDNDDVEQYCRFIQTDGCTTELLELREADELLAVAVTDVFTNGLSAVYTFYAPDKSARSLGTFAILRQIEECRQRNLKWLYLGYWIPDSPKMQYKSNFRPFEYFDGQSWLEKE